MQNNLIRLRKEAGLSQEELADKLAVSRQAVSKWERGEALPDTDNLIRLARLYNVSIDEIVGYAPEKETSADENKAAGGADGAKETDNASGADDAKETDNASGERRRQCRRRRRRILHAGRRNEKILLKNERRQAYTFRDGRKTKTHHNFRRR